MIRSLRIAIIAGVAFGVALGAYFAIRSRDLVTGVFVGVFGGLLFGPAIAAFSQRQRTRFAAQDPTVPGETLLKHGAANHLCRGEGVGGYLYLSDKRLFFDSHGYNIQDHQLSIPLDDIRGAQPITTAGLIPNGLLIQTDQGSETFAVDKRKTWVEAIRRAGSSESADTS